MDPKDIPDWAAKLFALGMVLTFVSAAATLFGFDQAAIGIPIGLLLIATGTRGAENARKPKS